MCQPMAQGPNGMPSVMPTAGLLWRATGRLRWNLRPVSRTIPSSRAGCHLAVQQARPAPTDLCRCVTHPAFLRCRHPARLTHECTPCRLPPAFTAISRARPGPGPGPPSTPLNYGRPGSEATRPPPPPSPPPPPANFSSSLTHQHRHPVLCHPTPSYFVAPAATSRSATSVWPLAAA